MQDYIESVIRLDGEGDVSILIEYIRQHPLNTDDLPHVIYQLLRAERVRVAYIIAKFLENALILHPGASIARCAGDILYGNLGDEERGLASLRAQTDLLSADIQHTLYATAVMPILPQLVMTAGASPNRDEMFLKVLALLKAATAEFRVVFDQDTVPAVFDLEERRRVGRERSRLLSLESPQTQAARTPRRVVVAGRDRWLSNEDTSRVHDIAPRIAAAMSRYGWPAILLPIAGEDPGAEYRIIGDRCLQHGAEVLIIDSDLTGQPQFLQAQTALIADLRASMPGLKVVALHLDAWAISPPLLREIASKVDAIWALAPSLSLWDEPELAGKVIHLQVPHAGEYGPPVQPLQPRLVFAGGVKGYNLHRIFWLAAGRHIGLPIEWKLSSHDSDGLSAIDSYVNYMRGLSEATCCISFSMRPNLSRIITGRTFEAILSGSLLVQETSPDLDYFFVSGEHYLEFSTFSELRSVIDFIVGRPVEAECIRQRGYAFARQRYNDDRLIGYLDYHLFGKLLQ